MTSVKNGVYAAIIDVTASWVNIAGMLAASLFG